MSALSKFPFSDDWSVFDLGPDKKRIRGSVVGIYDDHAKFHVPPLDNKYYTVVLELKKKRLGRYYLKLSDDEFTSLKFKKGETVDISGDYFRLMARTFCLMLSEHEVDHNGSISSIRSKKRKPEVDSETSK